MSTRRMLLVAGLALAGTAGLIGSADGQAPKRCPAGKLVDADRGGRVVATGRAPTYWVCLRGRRPYLMEANTSRTTVSHVRLASPYVAYRVSEFTTLGTSHELLVENVRRTRDRPGNSFVDGQLQALALSRRGVAVSVESGSDGRPQRVQRVDAEGESTLDTGAIDPASLAISSDGRRAYWLRDGAPQSAPL